MTGMNRVVWLRGSIASTLRLPDLPMH